MPMTASCITTIPRNSGHSSHVRIADTRRILEDARRVTLLFSFFISVSCILLPKASF